MKPVCLGSNGTPILVSGVARQAGVDRTFLYRHRDLLALVHAADLQPAGQDPVGSPDSRVRPAFRSQPERPARSAQAAAVLGESEYAGAPNRCVRIDRPGVQAQFTGKAGRQVE